MIFRMMSCMVFMYGVLVWCFSMVFNMVFWYGVFRSCVCIFESPMGQRIVKNPKVFEYFCLADWRAGRPSRGQRIKQPERPESVPDRRQIC